MPAVLSFLCSSPTAVCSSGWNFGTPSSSEERGRPGLLALSRPPTRGHSNPINPIDPINPINPIDPINPINPIDPINPINPINPISPINPIRIQTASRARSRWRRSYWRPNWTSTNDPNSRWTTPPHSCRCNLQFNDLLVFLRSHLLCSFLQVALLSGPPGLGKTTLAHVIAKHAGYNVVEINARLARPNILKMTPIVAAHRRPGPRCNHLVTPLWPRCDPVMTPL